MGFSHYWRRVEHLDPEGFANAAKDIRTILERVEERGVKIAGPTGVGNPECDRQTIAFNGKMNCGHGYRDMGNPWPSPEASGIAGAEDPVAAGEPYFSGPYLRARACGGNCDGGPFVIDRDWILASWHRPDGGMFSSSCATHFKPYDLAVTAALIRLKEHLGGEITISSDGDETAFADAKRLCRELFGWHRNFALETREPSLVP